MIFSWCPDVFVCVCALNLNFYTILNFLKNVCGSSNFRKISAKIYWTRTFGIELKFWIFSIFSSKLSANCRRRRRILSYRAQILCANAQIISNISYEIRWELVKAFKLWINLNFFLSWHENFKIRCIDDASSARKPKSNDVLPQRNNFVKSVRKQYGNPGSHAFFLYGK